MGAESAVQYPPKGASANGNGSPGADDGERLEGEHQDEQDQAKGTEKPKLILEGEKKLDLKVGGTIPQVASASLRTKMIHIPEGQYEKDDMIDLVLRVRCCNVSFPDKRSGGSMFTERKHDFEVVMVERVKD
jgi:hypothetical protein